MEIEEIRALTGLNRKKFSELYGIPYRTLENWEAPEGSANKRSCPAYVAELLRRVVDNDLRKGAE